jgi:hypothetical protein
LQLNVSMELTFTIYYRYFSNRSMIISLISVIIDRLYDGAVPAYPGAILFGNIVQKGNSYNGAQQRDYPDSSKKKKPGLKLKMHKIK